MGCLEGLQRGDKNMSEAMGLKAKLGLNVFKEFKKFHIEIKKGFEKDLRLANAVLICPAGLYTKNELGEVSVSEDGCLECGTCLIVCGKEILDWHYPEGGAGVQFRLG